MRYPATEKLEIIHLVEQSHLPTRQTLDKLGIPRRTFARWYARYLDGGPEALEDRPSAPSRVWNRLPEDVRKQIIDMALDESELSPRELATKFTDERQYFVSEATVYRLLKAQDLIASPAYIVIKARDEFHTKTTRPNEMWQTDFTYFKLIGWGLGLSLHRARRLFPLHHLVETVHHHDGGRCDGHAGSGAGRIRLRQRNRAAQTPPAVRQWAQLCRGRTGRLYRGAGHEPCSRRTLPSPDAGQD